MNWNSKQKRQRFFTMVFGAFLIFFTGYPHIWSVYQPYVVQETGWSVSQASLCFYLALLVFVFGNMIGGRLMGKWSIHKIIWVGGGIFSIGTVLSAFTLSFSTPIFMYLTYGIMQGLGQGMVYTTIIALAQKWFPGRIGLASGLIVTANGLCGFFLTPLSRTLLENGSVSHAILTVGSLMVLAWILAGIFVQSPPEDETYVPEGTEGISYTTGEMVRTGKYYLLLTAMFCGLMPYFLVSPMALTLQLERGVQVAVATLAITLGSVVNAGMRLSLPALSDRVGRVQCLRWVLTLAVFLMSILLLEEPSFTMAAVIWFYGYYGGVMGLFPSYTSSIFGLKYAG